MTGNQRRRFWVEAGLSAGTTVLAILTLISREWIEFLTGWGPDLGDGSLEWAIVLGLAVVALIAGVAARLEWGRAQPATDTIS